MKSLESNLLGLYTALISDVGRYYPKEMPEWRRAQVHLHAIMEARGSKFFTIDLVAVGKHFDRCLSTGTYTRSGLLYQRGLKRGDVRPRLFWALYRKVFRSTGTIRSDADLTAISLLRQLYYAAKKVKVNCDSKATFRAVNEFFGIERENLTPTYDWGIDSPGFGSGTCHLGDKVPSTGDGGQLSLPLGGTNSSESGIAKTPSSALLRLVQQVADRLSVDIGEVTYEAVLPKHGPGAVADVRVGRESKYSFPNWPAKLEASFPGIGYSLANEGLYSGQEEELWSPLLRNHEPPSGLTAVLKTQKAPRLIAKEPTSHQWMQQGVKRFLLDRFKLLFVSKSVDFRNQQHSQRAVLQASARGSGCSIDLSNASDRLTCWVVERIFRKNTSFLSAIHAVRTRWLVNTIDKKHPKYIKLKMFATAGSALTFPVQSIVFAIISIACTMYSRGVRPADDRQSNFQLRNLCWKHAGLVRVFGDDIIVPEEAYPLVNQVLSYLGLKVNLSKTFVGGKFYESCGVDAYAGVDVTPTYFLQAPVESAPESITSAVECSNNLHGAGLWQTAAWVVGLIPSKLRNSLGVWSIDSGIFGLKSFVGTSVTHLRKVWNDDYQIEELRVLSLTSRVKTREDEGSAALLQYFTEEPPPELFWKSGFPGRSIQTMRIVRIPRPDFRVRASGA